MKVLMINGSPNEKGCTYTALSQVAGALDKRGIESEIFWLGKEAIRGCIGCGGCRKAGKCVFDDKVNELAGSIDSIDALIIGSPVYYAGASGQITSFLDRFFYANGRCMAGKLGASVMSCRRGGATATFDQLNKYFTISNMPVVSSKYWNMVHGNTPEEVMQDAEGLQIMRVLGENMVWLLKSIEAGRNAGVTPPEYETPIATNFIR